MDKAKYYVGLMSGTSVDGIDAALVQFHSDTEFEILATRFSPFPEVIENEIRHTALNNTDLERTKDSALHTSLADLYAIAALEIIEEAKLFTDQISAIANHGQTVKHAPPLSIQLGDGQRVADLSSIPCICDFRQADLELGGQGAPLMPAFHRALFDDDGTRGESASSCIVNIGGIANLTVISEQLIGFDTGPGNCLMDMWIQHHNQLGYDKNGSWAASGKVSNELLEQLLADPYFSAASPKSTGTDYFNLDWLESSGGELMQKVNAQDVQRTLLQLTVNSISKEVESLCTEGTIYVCGGGAQNDLLLSELSQRLPSHTVSNSDAIGIPEDFMEAVGFAWLGYCHDLGISANEPSVTGACRKTVLGKKYNPKTKI